MKKWYLILTSLYFFNTSHAMELVKQYNENDTLIEVDLLKKKKSKAKTDWLFLSLADATKELQSLSIKKFNRAYSPKSRLLINMLRTFPIEVTEKIICTMLDYDEQATRIFMNIPAWYAFDQYQKAKQVLVKFPCRSAGMMFRACAKQKEAIQNLLEPNLTAQVFLGRDKAALTQEEIDEQISILSDDLRQEFLVGREIMVIDSETDTRLSNSPKICALLGCTLGVFGTAFGFLMHYLGNPIWIPVISMGGTLVTVVPVIGYSLISKFRKKAVIRTL